MADWIVRVQDKEYGPADLKTLREWKSEGRVLPVNQARRLDAELWMTAADIPGLFEVPPVQAVGAVAQPKRKPRKIAAETFRIYGKAFAQFFCLTLLVMVPSVCAQLNNTVLAASPNVDVDLRTLLAEGFDLSMLLLSVALWPVYIAGIQILTAEIAAGRHIGFLAVLNDAVKFWPRVALLCLLVLAAYFFWSVLPIVVIVMITLSGPSLVSFFLVLLILSFQVWITGRLFVNFMFWQQCAVLVGSDAGDSLRESKRLARSGHDLSWYRRPMWRGVFIASIWFAFVLAVNIGPEWQTLRHYFHELTISQDPQALLQALKAGSKAEAFNISRFALGLVQTLLRPLLGIAFVLLYFDAKEIAADDSTKG